VDVAFTAAGEGGEGARAAALLTTGDACVRAGAVRSSSAPGIKLSYNDYGGEEVNAKSDKVRWGVGWGGVREARR
jgi:hypothetical protein